LKVYSVPKDIPINRDYSVRVRPPGGDWVQVEAMAVKVDMHHVRVASLIRFDFDGVVEIEVVCRREEVETVDIRPHSRKIVPVVTENGEMRFTLTEPQKLSLEVNGDRFHNLHIIAKSIDDSAPDKLDPAVRWIKPGIHRSEDLLDQWNEEGVQTLGFEPGMHHIEEVLLKVPSGKSAYIAGGAVVAGSLVFDSVREAAVCGRGLIYLSEFGRFSAFRGVRLMYAEDIRIDGISVIDPPHYSIYMGQSQRVSVTDFDSFSTRGWSDGIDMMSCQNIEINNIFMRNSDDCIAIYAHRWGYYGDVRNISVRNAVLWADVAHPTMIGTHGDHNGAGDVIEQILFENVDILEHHEPQERYRGCLTINAGDNNLVRKVVYRNIRVEPYELGRLIDLQVVHNPDYNPLPGRGIEDITFSNIACEALDEVRSCLAGFDESRAVRRVHIDRLTINGKPVERADDAGIAIAEFASDITFS
jgi:hypothetical protein